MKILSRSSLRILSSFVFVTAVVLGPCLGICNDHELSAETIDHVENHNHAKHAKKCEHCGKHPQKTSQSDNEQAQNSGNCSECEKKQIENKIVCIENKEAVTHLLDSSDSLDTIFVKSNEINFNHYEQIEHHIQSVNSEIFPIPIYRKICSILE